MHTKHQRNHWILRIPELITSVLLVLTMQTAAFFLQPKSLCSFEKTFDKKLSYSIIVVYVKKSNPAL